MNARVGAAIGAVVALIALVVLLLVSGGSEAPSAFGDPGGDVTVADGPKPPADTTTADILQANVSRNGDDIEFRATMDAPIPKSVRDGSLSWRWDVYVDGASAWIVSAGVNVQRSASLTSTQSDYGTGTIDDSLPGELEIRGNNLLITLRPAEIPDWPSDFTWTLGTTLDGDQGDPQSALASDMAPDEGRGRVE